MNRALVIFASLSLTTLSAMLAMSACSGEDAKVPDASDAMIVKETGPDCGPLPTLTCFPGATGKACGDFPVPLKVVDDSGVCPKYGCGPGSVPVSECGCQAKTYNIEAGAECPTGSDAGTD